MQQTQTVEPLFSVASNEAGPKSAEKKSRTKGVQTEPRSPRNERLRHTEADASLTRNTLVVQVVLSFVTNLLKTLKLKTMHKRRSLTMANKVIGYNSFRTINNNAKRVLAVIKAKRAGTCDFTGISFKAGAEVSPILKNNKADGGKRNKTVWVLAGALCNFFDTNEVGAGWSFTAPSGKKFVCRDGAKSVYALWSPYYEESNAKLGYYAQHANAFDKDETETETPETPEAEEVTEADITPEADEDGPMYEGTNKRVVNKADDGIDAIKKLLGINATPDEVMAELKRLQEAEAKRSEWEKSSDSAPVTRGDLERYIEKVDQLEAEKTITLDSINADGVIEKIEGLLHKQFQKVLELVQAGENVLLVGPAGSGKSFMAEQIAAAMELPSYTICGSEDTSTYDLFGRRTIVDGHGQEAFVPGPFAKAYSGWSDERIECDAGLLVVDEYDAMHPNTVISMNVPLANGKCPLDRCWELPEVKRSPKFRFIAIGNTYGTGADYLYSRNRQDAASLNRFGGGTGVVFIDYDEAMEKAMLRKQIDASDTANWSLFDALLKLRRNVSENRVQQIVGMRTILSAHTRWMVCGHTPKAIIEDLTHGWTADEKAKALDGVFECLAD